MDICVFIQGRESLRQTTKITSSPYRGSQSLSLNFLSKIHWKISSPRRIRLYPPCKCQSQPPLSKKKLVGSRTAADNLTSTVEILLMTNAMAKTQVSQYFLFISSEKKASQGNISYYLVYVTWLCEKYQILCTLRCSIVIKSNCWKDSKPSS